MSIGPWQIILIVVLVLIFFGPSRIPGLGKSVGEAIRGFKKGLDSEDDDTTPSKNTEDRKTELLAGDVVETKANKVDKKEKV
jgi:sec-independent protein translocase protein TatA